MTHTIVLTKMKYERTEVRKILNDLKSIHSLDLDIRYGVKKSNKQRKVKFTN